MLEANTVQVLSSLGNKDKGLAETESLASLFFLVVAPSRAGLNGLTTVCFGGNLILGPWLSLGPGGDRTISGELTDFWGFNTG